MHRACVLLLSNTTATPVNARIDIEAPGGSNAIFIASAGYNSAGTTTCWANVLR